eukprot:CAMPEP_0183721342 /NCGR_PEP_ID=MMETSP0737-20130205/13649_1 /TAXON_ID=385413 /ORGANISM="Thalassiosira miniscula, Strain CCMP1093" /LENGTH=57 /DNA_ID=CAMNT_0025951333 /DNA_START=412 /DNA_END=585 /DNA_ORIENTATION=-
MVGAASRDVVEGCVVVMDEIACVLWMGVEGTKACPMASMAANANADMRVIVLFAFLF